MKKKYDNTSNNYAEWTTAKLKNEAKMYHEIIYGECSCYGVGDMRMYHGLLGELEKRGITPKNQITF